MLFQGHLPSSKAVNQGGVLGKVTARNWKAGPSSAQAMNSPMVVNTWVALGHSGHEEAKVLMYPLAPASLGTHRSWYPLNM